MGRCGLLILRLAVGRALTSSDQIGVPGNSYISILILFWVALVRYSVIPVLTKPAEGDNLPVT